MPESSQNLEIYDKIIIAFNNAYTSDYRFGRAATLFAPLYDKIFGPGLVSNHLKKDILSHAHGVIEAAQVKPEYEYVDQMVPNMIAEIPMSERKKNWGDGVLELLWTKRSLEFISRFLLYGVDDYIDWSLKDCAKKAYEEILKPYHSIVVSCIVKMTFSLTPTRSEFLRSLGFDSLESAQKKLKLFLASIVPVINHIDVVLKQYDCDIPDKV